MIRRASYNEPALTPLPYNTEISDNNTIFNPRSSFTKHLQRSSYLFPKRKSSSSDTDTDKQQRYPRTMNRVTLDHHDDDNNTKKMRYNDSDNKMRLKELYSVSAFEDTPTISQSPTDARGDMNIMNTKQDQHCNVKPPPLCGLTTDDNDERHVTNMTKSIINNKNNSSDKKKKSYSVSFLPQVSTKYPLSNSIHTPTTPQYKSQLWYTPTEYDQFKYQAALDCGIKLLMQSNNVSSSQKNDGKRKKRGPQFIQIGDFDCKKNENINDNTTINVAAASSHPSLSSMDTPPTDNTKDKKFSRYYNENEYNDSPVEEQNSSTAAHGKVFDLISNEPQQQEKEPAVICKRGLGYHFSRTRKRARMSTRSAVLAWQKNLRGASNTTSNSQATANDKSTMMLALVSSKCSRVAREEAKWRGLVDYKVAYPERHQELSIANEKVQLDNDMNMNDKKRSHDDSITAAAPIIHTDIASRSNKRQRPNDTGNDTNKMQRWNGAVFEHNSSNRDELILSPETVGYLVNGVQYAKV